MAIQPVQISYPESMGQRVLVARWDNLAYLDYGEALPIGLLTDLSIQAIGTFGVGGTLRFMASNFAIDGNYNTCYDERGDLCLITSPGSVRSITDPVAYGKPYVAVGDGTTLMSAILVGRFIKRRRHRT